MDPTKQATMQCLALKKTSKVSLSSRLLIQWDRPALPLGAMYCIPSGIITQNKPFPPGREGGGHSEKGEGRERHSARGLSGLLKKTQ